MRHELGLADGLIIAAYFAILAVMGFLLKRRATRNTDAFFLAGRSVPWWMLGLSGCSSYIDISGTIAVVTAIYYVGAKSSWVFHVVWGCFTMAFFMAYQAKYIRRSGVMTFAEWNRTRFGAGRAPELARLASALFVVVLMICNFTYVSVGVGKFASEFLPLAPWQTALIVFAVVGLYCSLGGFMGVILTDVFQTLLIAAGAVALSVMAFKIDVGPILAANDPGWASAAPAWRLWPTFGASAQKSFAHYDHFGLLLTASLPWLLFRLLSGPNVWDFQFFLSVRSARDASLSAGIWTAASLMRWFIAVALVIVGVASFGVSGKEFDGERLLPLALTRLPFGMKGVFVAVMLAALMSTLSAMANLLSAVITNDFVRRYMGAARTERQLVRIGQAVSAVAMAAGFATSLAFTSVVAIWELMLFVVVTMILVPATMRWHWWRFGPAAFVWSMAVSALICLGHKVFFPNADTASGLLIVVPASLAATVACGFLCAPADRETLVSFYAKVRPFGVWGPIRKEAVARGLVPEHDPQPTLDIVNAVLACAFQFVLSLIPFCLLTKQWPQMFVWSAATAVLCIALYFTWYRTLPAADEDVEPNAAEATAPDKTF